MKDTEINKRDLNLHLGNIAGAATIIDCIVQTIFRGKELSRPVFGALLLCIILYVIFHIRDLLQKLTRTYLLHQDRKQNLIEKKSDGTLSSTDYVYNRDCLNIKFKESIRKSVLRKGAGILAGTVTALVLCLLNIENTHAYWSAFRTAFSTTGKENNSPQAAPAESEAQIPVVEASDEEPHPLREKSWRFVLMDPDADLVLPVEVENEVFFFWHDLTLEDDFMTNYAKEHFPRQLEGVNLSQAMTDENKTFSIYNMEENDFKNSVSAASGLLYLDEWIDKAPRSDKMDAYMKGRRQLNTIDIDGKQGNYEIWWKLANDNQYYALEYDRQTKNGEAILYYYGMSIDCCMKALTYSMDDSTYQMIYHYMTERYHDIRDNDLINDDYQKRAGEIYAHM